MNLVGLRESLEYAAPWPLWKGGGWWHDETTPAWALGLPCACVGVLRVPAASEFVGQVTHHATWVVGSCCCCTYCCVAFAFVVGFHCCCCLVVAFNFVFLSWQHNLFICVGLGLPQDAFCFVFISQRCLNSLVTDWTALSGALWAGSRPALGQPLSPAASAAIQISRGADKGEAISLNILFKTIYL